MVHMDDAAKCGYKNVMIRTVNSAVVVLAVVTFTLLRDSLKSLWVAFGTGNQFRYIPAHAISRSLGPRKCQGLPFFHAFAGCDNVSFLKVRERKVHGTHG
ncbi:MAG: hypothetical protein M3H12_06800, partial [Chromatiales bacterium]